METYTAEEIWELASEPSIDFEFHHVLAMSDDEIRASLASRGHDLRVLEAEAKVMFGLPRKRSTFRAGYIGAGAVATLSALAAGVMAVASGPAQTVITAATAASPPQSASDVAEQMRFAAFRACDNGEWQRCLDLLDQARAIDPQGDSDPLVRFAREKATKGSSAPR